MAYEQRTNSGAIFTNKRKTANDKFPDYEGTLNVEGKDYWISAWAKTSSRDGSEFFSLSIKPKEARKQPELGPKPF